METLNLTRHSLKDQIKDILIKRIIEGELIPGDRIKELPLAKEFGTSQAPVREAIRCLETLGYIEHTPHVGATVRTFDWREIEDAYQVREAFETFAVSRIDMDIDALVAQLETILEEMRKAAEKNDIRGFTTADNRFHKSIITASKNNTMSSMWDSLRMQLQVVATLVEVNMPLEEIYKLHPPIVDALKMKHLQGASAHLTSHYHVIGNYWNKLKSKAA